MLKMVDKCRRHPITGRRPTQRLPTGGPQQRDAATHDHVLQHQERRVQRGGPRVTTQAADGVPTSRSDDLEPPAQRIAAGPTRFAKPHGAGGRHPGKRRVLGVLKPFRAALEPAITTRHQGATNTLIRSSMRRATVSEVELRLTESSSVIQHSFSQPTR
jgi:hypothetical protein